MIQAKRARVKENKRGGSWLKLLALGMGIYLSWTLGKGVLELKLAYRRIDEARQILAMEQSRGEDLKRKWADIQTPEYLEKVARNDLNMQKEGETVVVIQKTSGEARSRSAGQKLESVDEPNWQKWLNLLR
jgi:cell division protein FtsB